MSNQRIAGVETISPTLDDIAMTGDRPTGRLHLGHYAGSITNRLKLQEQCLQVVLIADLQALTDNAGNPAKVRNNVTEVMLDYLACGIDPARSIICLQSDLPELSELTMLYLNLVNTGALHRNPTVKAEIEARGMGESVPAGFLAYPVSQAADITAFAATIVPVGADQLPILEIAEHVVATLERMQGRSVLPRPRPMLSSVNRLPGIDGRAKASKSLGNAIDLSDEMDEVRRKVMAMYTDPAHIRIDDPGQVEGNVVFAYLDAFDDDVDTLTDLKQHYSRGGLGDVALKRRLIDVLDRTLSPIREERTRLSKDLAHVRDVLRAGTERAREKASTNLDKVREVFGLESRD